MSNLKITQLTEDTAPTFDDLVATVNDPAGTPATKKAKLVNVTGSQVNAQTGTTYTYLTTDFRKLVTHTNASAIAATLPQAGASFPAGWFMLVQNRGAGAVTITPTTSTIDGAATLVLNQNEGAIIVSDGTNYFTLRGKATGAAGVGDVVGPGSATDNALARFDSTTGKLIQNSTITLDDTGALTVPEMAAPSTPASGKVAVYAKSDGKLYIKDDAGTESDLTSSAPSGAAGGGLSGTYPNPPVKTVIAIAASDETTALTTGTAKVTFRMPHAMTLTDTRASLSTAQTSGSILTVDVNEGGTTILSTKITIDNSEKTSTTAATPPIISDSALADDAEITIDIDQVGDGTAKGLKVYLIGTRS